MNDSLFHDPDDGWAYAKPADVPLARWPFAGGGAVPAPYVWNGAAWIRYYGAEFSEAQIEMYKYWCEIVLDTTRLND